MRSTTKGLVKCQREIASKVKTVKHTWLFRLHWPLVEESLAEECVRIVPEWKEQHQFDLSDRPVAFLTIVGISGKGYRQMTSRSAKERVLMGVGTGSP